MRNALFEQILEDEAATANTLAGVLQQTAPAGGVATAAGQRYTQHLVEHLDIGAGAYALVTTRDGLILAHPVSSYLGTGVGQEKITVGGQPMTLAGANAAAMSVRGWAADPSTGEQRLVATHWSPSLQAAVCVFQNPEVVQRRTHELNTFFLRTTFLLWAVLLIAVWFIVGTLVDKYESRFASLARTDTLTGLGNRRVLAEALAREAPSLQHLQRGLAAIAVDLDDFKPINDEYGHAAGDRALQALAAALKRISPDYAFRLGGDEFLLLLPDVTQDQAEIELDRVRRCFPLTIPLDNGRQLEIEGSSGYAYVAPGESAHKLLFHADQALYLHKSVRKNQKKKALQMSRAAGHEYSARR